MTTPKSNDQELICEGCKAAVNQSLAARQGHTTNCVAYGCNTWFRNPCRAYDIFRYTWDRLKEEGMLNENRKST